jgi:hypothetical protein
MMLFDLCMTFPSSLSMAIIALFCREIKIEAAFKLWNDTAQDDYRLAGRKEHLDYLTNKSNVLLKLLAGGQSSNSQLFPGNILEFHHPRFDADPNTPSITHFQGRAVAVLQEVRCCFPTSLSL